MRRGRAVVGEVLRGVLRQGLHVNYVLDVLGALDVHDAFDVHDVLDAHDALDALVLKLVPVGRCTRPCLSRPLKQYSSRPGSIGRTAGTREGRSPGYVQCIRNQRGDSRCGGSCLRQGRKS